VADALTFSVFTEIMKATMLPMESSHVSLRPFRKEVLKSISHMEGAHAGSVKACAAPSHSVGRAEDNSAGANSHDGYQGFRSHEFPNSRQLSILALNTSIISPLTPKCENFVNQTDVIMLIPRGVLRNASRAFT
jgi:hypothetical protein